MKKIIWLFFALLIAGNSYSQSGQLASNIDDAIGRCTGSSHCTACKNCKYCKHCSENGGTCGICSYSPTNGSKPRNSRNTINANSSQRSSNLYTAKSPLDYFLLDDISSEYYARILVVTSEAVNMRSGPGTSYRVVQKLLQGAELIYLAEKGSWVKVRRKDKNVQGFIYYKYLALK